VHSRTPAIAARSRGEPAGQHDGRAGPADLQQPGGEAVDVEQGQRQQDPVDPVDRRRAERTRLLAVGQQRAVRQLYPARAPGGAGGEHDQRDALGVGGSPVDRGVRDRGGQVRRAQQRRADALGAAGRDGVVGPGDDRDRPGLVEHDLELAGHRARAERYDDRVCPQRAEQGHAVTGAVGQADRDPVAVADTRRTQPGGLGGDRGVERRPGQRERRRAGQVTDGVVARTLGGVARHQVGEVGGPVGTVARHGVGTRHGGLHPRTRRGGVGSSARVAASVPNPATTVVSRGTAHRCVRHVSIRTRFAHGSSTARIGPLAGTARDERRRVRCATRQTSMLRRYMKFNA
jgi:hypothetical protein